MFGLFVELIGVQIPLWFAGALYIAICSVYLRLLWRSQKECERLAQVVYTDTATGFMNFAALEEDLSTTKGPVAVIFVSLDLDNQPGYRHTEILYKTAQALEIIAEPHNNIYRYSDNEFVVLLSGKHASLSAAENAAERIKHYASYFGINLTTGVSLAWKDGLFAIDRAKQEIQIKYANKKKRPVLCYSRKTPASNNA